MPWNLFARSKEDREEEERADRLARMKIEKINREIEVYDSHGWNNYFLPRLQKILDDDTNALIGCPPDEVPVVRARIKLVRHLAELGENLKRERAELQRGRENREEDE